MPAGVYERQSSPARSNAAKARGATGFLHAQRDYRVSAAGKHCADEWATRNLRLAVQKFNYLVRQTKHRGRYFGARVSLECDGQEISNNRTPTNGTKRKNQYA